MLWYQDALDNLHLDIVLQLLQVGADVQAVATAQVRPRAMLCISASLHCCHQATTIKVFVIMVILQHMQPRHMHTRRLRWRVKALH